MSRICIAFFQANWDLALYNIISQEMFDVIVLQDRDVEDQVPFSYSFQQLRTNEYSEFQHHQPTLYKV